MFQIREGFNGYRAFVYYKILYRSTVSRPLMYPYENPNQGIFFFQGYRLTKGWRCD